MHYLSLSAAGQYQFIYSEEDEDVRAQTESSVYVEIVVLARILAPSFHDDGGGSSEADPQEHGQTD